jgi:predicted nucleic acid-binding protein
VELVLELISASNIEVLKTEKLQEFEEESEKISPRKNDVPYFAVALCKKCAIWSNDKPIRKQTRIKVISTGELLAYLEAMGTK